MIRLIRAEFLKLRTTQVWFWLLLAALALAALLTIGPIASGDIKHPKDLADLFTGAATSYLPVFVLGVLGVTTEFRYQTITPTVLATPSRWALITAKMVTYLLVGAAYAALCVVLQLAISVPWLSAKNVDVTLGSHNVPRALVSVFAVVVLFAIIGIGVGALVKNQIVAVSVGIIVIQVVNPLIGAIPKVRAVFPYTPFGGLSALLNSEGRGNDGFTLLTHWGGAVVLLLWAFVPAIIGAAYTMNRDIT
ncbi:MAG TPA: ABC transporter permease [Jatrophihabitantaceae bacterium]|nr:ABC transporter permease [Jatrophihabitantaceae bacterium]